MQYLLITILPLQGIQLGDQIISLGSTTAEVEAILGRPEIVRNSYYYFGSELRLDFSEDGKLEFIEFLAGLDGKIQPVIYGIQAFQADADELYRVLEKHASGNIIDDENGYSFAFPNIGIGVYRESTPADVISLTCELKESGVNIAGDPDIEEEQLKASHWATISVATSEYRW